MRVVVLGTGTAVGKTYVTTHLARALAARDPARPVLALKPLETGVTDPRASDAASLDGVAHLATPPTPHPLFAFPLPLSPHLAAHRAGTEVSLPAIVRWANAATLHYTTTLTVLLETAGGVFSPLTPSATNFDLACALEPSVWLLVAPDAIGVLHDLTATLFAMRARRRLPDLVVLTAARPTDPSTGANAFELEALAICRVAAVLGLDDPSPLDAVAATLQNPTRVP
jgi:dethiobiotin synthetase